MSLSPYEVLVLIGLFAIGVGVYKLQMQLKNYYRIVTPIIEDWYARNSDKKIPRD